MAISLPAGRRLAEEHGSQVGKAPHPAGSVLSEVPPHKKAEWPHPGQEAVNERSFSARSFINSTLFHTVILFRFSLSRKPEHK